jgi:hypothetical protein
MSIDKEKKYKNDKIIGITTHPSIATLNVSGHSSTIKDTLAQWIKNKIQQIFASK